MTHAGEDKGPYEHHAEDLALHQDGSPEHVAVEHGSLDGNIDEGPPGQEKSRVVDGPEKGHAEAPFRHGVEHTVQGGDDKNQESRPHQGTVPARMRG